MRCHQCNQDSIKIYNSDGESSVCIKCDICGLRIGCGGDTELLCDLFLYNESLEEAEKLGQEAFVSGKGLEDNPYSLDSNQIMLNKKWEKGYIKERRIYEYSALSLSSKKIEEQLNLDIEGYKKEIGTVNKENVNLNVKIGKLFIENKNFIDNICDIFSNAWIFGKMGKKSILAIKEGYNKIIKKQKEEFK